MPKISIDGREIECRTGVSVLQAALDAGFNIPHYCYHPGLSIVASCRLCLMELKLPDPRTRALSWSPKLVPSCQTPVKEGLEVRFDSPAVRENQRQVMEYYLLNHPLDCPVCDKAGECSLQDYTERFGPAASRMIEDKLKNPKKDIGPHTLLYQDRCVLCSRCVRFVDEIAGTGELRVVNRGSRCEIDVFPGVPLANALQGNVVDLCPVGALLDKDFLFKERVWQLRSTPSVSPADSRGQTIWIDHSDGRMRRVRPRYNERVNEWWISDEARFGWGYVQRADRLRLPTVLPHVASGAPAGRPSEPRVVASGQSEPERQRGAAAADVPPAAAPTTAQEQWHADEHITAQEQWHADALGRVPIGWETLPGLLRDGFVAAARGDEGARVASVLSPMLSCEEAWLLGTYIRRVAPRAALVLGHVPAVGEDRILGTRSASERLPVRQGFVIKAEKCPNRRGVEMIVGHFGGKTLAFREFLGQAVEGRFSAAYVTAGYPGAWATPEVALALGKIGFLVVHDLFPSALDAVAAVRIPGATWAEREGTFMNCDGLVQAFARAIAPPEGVKADGQLLQELTGGTGLYRSAMVREALAAALPALADVFAPRELPRDAH